MRLRECFLFPVEVFREDLFHEVLVDGLLTFGVEFPNDCFGSSSMRVVYVLDGLHALQAVFLGITVILLGQRIRKCAW